MPSWDIAGLVSNPAPLASIWFGFAILLLDRFDISLPRGDSVGVSGALIVSGIMVAGVWPLAAWAMLSVVLARVGQAGRSWARLRTAAMVRGTAIAVAVLLVTLSPRALVGAGVWLVVVPVIYLLCEAVIAQLYSALTSRRPLARLLRGNLERQLPLIAAQGSAAALTLMTYPHMGPWTLVLVVALLLLIRQSMALLLTIRSTYRATVEALVEAAESQDPRRRGHAERTAKISRRIAERIGMSAAEVERVSYCALLHDIDQIRDDASDDLLSARDLGQSSAVLRDIAFFEDVVPVLRLCDGLVPDEGTPESVLSTSMVVALASDIDALTNEGLRSAHPVQAVGRVGRTVPATSKARIVAAAIELGYEIPAVR